MEQRHYSFMVPPEQPEDEAPASWRDYAGWLGLTLGAILLILLFVLAVAVKAHLISVTIDL